MRLTGRLREGVLATDLALRVTSLLRTIALSGRFVEFFGPGVSTLSAGDRSVVANMAPEYGSSSGYFPIDDRTIAYLLATGRTAEHAAFVEAYARRTGLWFDPEARPVYDHVLDLDLNTVTVALAGPRRPQDLLTPDRTRAAIAPMRRADALPPTPADPVPDACVAIAAITSCTNTSDPRLLVAAGFSPARPAPSASRRGDGSRPPSRPARRPPSATCVAPACWRIWRRSGSASSDTAAPPASAIRALCRPR